MVLLADPAVAVEYRALYTSILKILLADQALLDKVTLAAVPLAVVIPHLDPVVAVVQEDPEVLG
jgi:hypothetical protein